MCVCVRETDGVFPTDLTNGPRDTIYLGHILRSGWMGGWKWGYVSVSVSEQIAKLSCSPPHNPTTLFSFATASNHHIDYRWNYD